MPRGQDAVVTAVMDGDTIEAVQASGSSVEVRLVGLNAPEADECHFTQARDYLTSEVLGASIELETVGVDRFGRTLAFVSVGDIEINESLVALGHAIALTTGSDTLDTDRLLEAEKEAAESDRGLWADDVCGANGPIPPVRIAEFDFNPNGPDEERLDQEFVVIINGGNSHIDLSNWVLRDESSLHRHVFEPGTQLGAGASLTVTSANPSWDPGGSPVWNNGGDLILLMDGWGRVVDAIRY